MKQRSKPQTFVRILLIASIIQLVCSQQLRSQKNYGQFLGNVKYRSLRYDWKINFAPNPNFQSPKLPQGITSGQFQTVTGWISDTNITISLAPQRWKDASQIVVLKSQTTATLAQPIICKAGRYVIQFRFSQSDDCLLGNGWLHVQFNGLTIERIVPSDKDVHYFTAQITAFEGTNTLKFKASSQNGQFKIQIGKIGVFRLKEQYNRINQVYAVMSGDSVQTSQRWDAYHDNYLLDYSNTGHIGAWVSATNDQRAWLKVGSHNIETYVAVVTQGRFDLDQWVKSYRVMYTVTGASDDWQYVDNGRVFIGNTDRNSKVRVNFNTPVRARAIRIHPVSWNAYISIRFDVIYLDGSRVETSDE